MKALTLTQPWASAVVQGVKRYETRSWSTKHRGWLAIHSAKGMTRENERMFVQLFSEGVLKGEIMGAAEMAGWEMLSIPRGMIIGFVRVDDVLMTGGAQPTGLEHRLGDWQAGRFAWQLSNPIRLQEPIKAKGSLGLWNWQIDRESWVRMLNVPDDLALELMPNDCRRDGTRVAREDRGAAAGNGPCRPVFPRHVRLGGGIARGCARADRGGE
jgi:hypothetical protein